MFYCSNVIYMVRSESKNPILRRDLKHCQHILLYGIFFSVFLFLISLFNPTFFDFLNNRVYDTLLSANPGQPSPTPVIIDIDEKSLRQYGQWPWPRYRIAILIDKLRELGASSIGLDMMFAEDDRTSLVSIRKELLHDFGVDFGFGEVPQDLRDSDQRLADALSRGRVILGYQFLFEEDSDSGNCLLHPIPINNLGHSEDKKVSAVFINSRGVSCNLKKLSQAAGSSGFFNVSVDRDGILRSVPLIMEYKGRFYPSLALATLIRSIGVKDILLKTGNSDGDSLYLDKTAIPLTSKGNLLLRYRGKSKTFQYISAADILADRVPKEKIQKKIVFVGTSASGMKEFKSTPFDPIFPGVEIHATVVDNILKKDFLSRPRWALGLESLLALFLGLFSTFIFAWTGPVWSSLLLAATGAGVWQTSVWVFRNESTFISPILPLMVLVCNFSLITFFKFQFSDIISTSLS